MDTSKSRDMWASPDIGFMRECFYIDSDGDPVWKSRPREHFTLTCSFNAWNTKYAGRKAGNVKPARRAKTSYRSIYIAVDGKQRHISGHRLAWAIHHGEWPEGIIDHIDGCGLNNKISNLRIVTPEQNSRNRRRGVNNKTGIIGVSESGHKGYMAYCTRKNRSVTLGHFDNIFDAACARKSFEFSKGFHENHGRPSSSPERA